MELKKLKWEIPELVALNKSANGFDLGTSCQGGSSATAVCLTGGQIVD